MGPTMLCVVDDHRHWLAWRWMYALDFFLQMLSQVFDFSKLSDVFFPDLCILECVPTSQILTTAADTGCFQNLNERKEQEEIAVVGMQWIRAQGQEEEPQVQPR